MIASLCFGAAGIWHGLRNSNPTGVTLSGNSPGDLPKHVTLKHVVLAAGDAVTITEYGKAGVYVPIRAQGAQASDPIFLLLKSNDPGLLALATHPAQNPANAEGTRNALAALGKIAAQTEVTGMTETDFNVSNRLKSALKKALPSLHPHFVIINQGETPSVMRGIGLLALGVVLFVLLGLSSMTDDDGKAEPPPLTPAKPAEPPPLTSRV